MDRLWHTTNIYMHPGIHEYAEKLTAKLPGNLKVSPALYMALSAIGLCILPTVGHMATEIMALTHGLLISFTNSG